MDAVGASRTEDAHLTAAAAIASRFVGVRRWDLTLRPLRVERASLLPVPERNGLCQARGRPRSCLTRPVVPINLCSRRDCNGNR
jgi:hypothetical protein